MATRVSNFKFLGVEDCGATSCPHCGAEGRYIYTWEEDGIPRAAMAGCYKALTGHINKDDKQLYFELLSEKQAKNKPLNGWDKNIIRLLQYKSDNTYPKEWCDKKINDVLSERQIYLQRKRH